MADDEGISPLLSHQREDALWDRVEAGPPVKVRRWGGIQAGARCGVGQGTHRCCGNRSGAAGRGGAGHGTSVADGSSPLSTTRGLLLPPSPERRIDWLTWVMAGPSLTAAGPYPKAGGPHRGGPFEGAPRRSAAHAAEERRAKGGGVPSGGGLQLVCVLTLISMPLLLLCACAAWSVGNRAIAAVRLHPFALAFPLVPSARWAPRPPLPCCCNPPSGQPLHLLPCHQPRPLVLLTLCVSRCVCDAVCLTLCVSCARCRPQDKLVLSKIGDDSIITMVRGVPLNQMEQSHATIACETGVMPRCCSPGHPCLALAADACHVKTHVLPSQVGPLLLRPLLFCSLHRALTGRTLTLRRPGAASWASRLSSRRVGAAGGRQGGCQSFGQG